MTWIKTVPPSAADEKLLAIYQELRGMYPPEYFGEPVPALVRPDGTSDSVSAAHSLIPEAMRHLFAGLAALLRPGLGLTRRQQEMIASVVSAQNRCFYWVESHTEFLRRACLDDELAAALRRDHREAELDAADRAMLDFVVRLTHEAYKLQPADLDRLREVGFDDRAILQITLIAGWFNYINRVADALGVGRPDA